MYDAHMCTDLYWHTPSRTSTIAVIRSFPYLSRRDTKKIESGRRMSLRAQFKICTLYLIQFYSGSYSGRAWGLSSPSDQGARAAHVRNRRAHAVQDQEVHAA